MRSLKKSFTIAWKLLRCSWWGRMFGARWRWYRA